MLALDQPHVLRPAVVCLALPLVGGNGRCALKYRFLNPETVTDRRGKRRGQRPAAAGERETAVCLALPLMGGNGRCSSIGRKLLVSN